VHSAAGTEEEEERVTTGPTFLFDGLFGATAFCVLVVIDTVAEIAAPRPNWRDVVLVRRAARLCRLAKQWVQTGERWRFLCLERNRP
jgi:hypothetical protein